MPPPVEIDPHACKTLRLNRPEWDVIQLDVHHFKGVDYRGVAPLTDHIGVSQTLRSQPVTTLPTSWVDYVAELLSLAAVLGITGA